MNYRKFKRTQFVWNRIFFDIIYCHCQTCL